MEYLEILELGSNPRYMNHTLEPVMEHITINEFENRLRNVFVRVADDQEPIAVVMDEGREIILVDGNEYRSVMETFHLLRSPANAERLRQGIKQHKEGKTKSIDVETYLGLTAV